MVSSTILRSSFNPAVKDGNFCEEKQMFHVQQTGTGLERGKGISVLPFPRVLRCTCMPLARQSVGQLIHSKPSKWTFLLLLQKA